MQNLNYLEEMAGGTQPQTTSSLATTQPVATAPQTFGSGASTLGQPITQSTQQTNPWVDIGLNIEGGGNMLAPTFTKDDWEWRDQVINQQQMGGGDSGTWMEDAYGPAAGWYLTDTARARLGDQWTKGDTTNIDWSSGGWNPLAQTVDRNTYFGSQGDNPTYDPAGYESAISTLKAQNPWDYLQNNGFQARVKSADKAGSYVNFKGNNPTLVGKGYWDTNPSEMNAALAKSVAAFASLGTLAPAMAGSSGLGQLFQGVNFMNTVSGGQLPGLREAGLVGSLYNGGTGFINGLSKGISGIGDVANLAKSGYNVYSKGSKLMDMFSGPDEQQAYGGGGTAPNLMPSGGGFDLGSLIGMFTGGAGGGNTGLADLWGAWEGSRQAKDASGNFKQMYTDAQARRQPSLDRLNESYTNPDSFYGSNQWKGLSDVYKNSIDRTAASKGRLANPTDREVLLNNYAMKEMENYRSGLRGNAQILNPDAYINPNMRGLDLERGANNPWGAAIGRGSVGGPGLQEGASGLQQLISQLLGKGGSSGGYGTNPDLAKVIGQFINQPGGSGPGGVGMGNWSSGGDMDSPYNPFTGYNEPVYGGDTYGDGPMDWGPAMSDPDWGFSGFNPDGGNGFSYGDFDVEDTGWLDDIGSWFDW